MPNQLRVLVFGAHPDDPDWYVAGIGIKYARLGHRVKFISMTNGNTGHYAMGGGVLARRNYEEMERAAETGTQIEFEILDINNGQLLPTLEYRWWVVRLIREFQADLVLTHRPNDYHPDHRYTAQLVHDAAYTVTIPNIQALTPHMQRNPVIAYMLDNFQKPYPFVPDVVVGIDDVVEEKIDKLDCFEGQMYEWLPYNEGTLDQVPADLQERRAWLSKSVRPTFAEPADKYRARLIQLYGEEKGARFQYAEALEFCEYGSPVTAENFHVLFPFFRD